MKCPVAYPEVFLVDLKRPWKPIRRETCPEIIGKKFTWVECKGRRHLLGGSAFFMRKGAERRKKHRLEQDAVIPIWACHNRRQLARAALKEIRETGVIN